MHSIGMLYSTRNFFFKESSVLVFQALVALLCRAVDFDGRGLWLFYLSGQCFPNPLNFYFYLTFLNLLLDFYSLVFSYCVQLYVCSVSVNSDIYFLAQKVVFFWQFFCPIAFCSDH